tara:strand:+ start:99 stop:500 length:402 start_codon:yes stop_codon:yes gene_type:complete
MGLDQYAYAIHPETGEQVSLQTWRKHPNLQGFMEQLWESKGRPCYSKEEGGDVPFNPDEDGGSLGDFNCIPLRLLAEDIDNLEDVINREVLPPTSGFFFGTSRPEDKYLDESFIKKARKFINKGYHVVYDSWW